MAGPAAARAAHAGLDAATRALATRTGTGGTAIEPRRCDAAIREPGLVPQCLVLPCDGRGPIRR